MSTDFYDKLLLKDDEKEKETNFFDSIPDKAPSTKDASMDFYTNLGIQDNQAPEDFLPQEEWNNYVAQREAAPIVGIGEDVQKARITAKKYPEPVYQGATPDTLAMDMTERQYIADPTFKQMLGNVSVTPLAAIEAGYKGVSNLLGGIISTGNAALNKVSTGGFGAEDRSVKEIWQSVGMLENGVADIVTKGLDSVIINGDESYEDLVKKYFLTEYIGQVAELGSVIGLRRDIKAIKEGIAGARKEAGSLRNFLKQRIKQFTGNESPNEIAQRILKAESIQKELRSLTPEKREAVKKILLNKNREAFRSADTEKAAGAFDLAPQKPGTPPALTQQAPQATTMPPEAIKPVSKVEVPLKPTKPTEGIIDKVAPTTAQPTDLIEEAKKYKSVEEFVEDLFLGKEVIAKKTKMQPYYHATTEANYDKIGKEGFKAGIGERSIGMTKAKGVWLYDDFQNAWKFSNLDQFGESGSRVVQTVVDGKVYDISEDKDFKTITKVAADKKFIDKLKSEGYVGVTGNEALIVRGQKLPKKTRTTFIFDPSAIKTKAQLTDIWNKANKSQSLEEEAKKYKSAEEFVKSKKAVYHGTDAEFEIPSIRYAGRTDEGFMGAGIYASGTKGGAKLYGKNVKEFYFDLKNPLVIEDAYAFGGVNPDKIRDILGIPKTAKPSAVRDALIEQGYDGVIVNEITDNGIKKNVEVVALGNKQIKTKSQLTDIWNKANAKQGIDAQARQAVAEGKSLEGVSTDDSSLLKKLDEAQNKVVEAVKKHGFGGVAKSQQHPDLIKAQENRQKIFNEVYNEKMPELPIGSKVKYGGEVYTIENVDFDVVQALDNVKKGVNTGRSYSATLILRDSKGNKNLAHPTEVEAYNKANAEQQSKPRQSESFIQKEAKVLDAYEKKYGVSKADAIEQQDGAILREIVEKKPNSAPFKLAEEWHNKAVEAGIVSDEVQQEMKPIQAERQKVLKDVDTGEAGKITPDERYRSYRANRDLPKKHLEDMFGGKKAVAELEHRYLDETNKIYQDSETISTSDADASTGEKNKFTAFMQALRDETGAINFGKAPESSSLAGGSIENNVVDGAAKEHEQYKQKLDRVSEKGKIYRAGIVKSYLWNISELAGRVEEATGAYGLQELGERVFDNRKIYLHAERKLMEKVVDLGKNPSNDAVDEFVEEIDKIRKPIVVEQRIHRYAMEDIDSGFTDEQVEFLKPFRELYESDREAYFSAVNKAMNDPAAQKMLTKGKYEIQETEDVNIIDSPLKEARGVENISKKSLKARTTVGNLVEDPQEKLLKQFKHTLNLLRLHYLRQPINDFYETMSKFVSRETSERLKRNLQQMAGIGEFSGDAFNQLKRNMGNLYKVVSTKLKMQAKNIFQTELGGTALKPFDRAMEARFATEKSFIKEFGEEMYKRVSALDLEDQFIMRELFAETLGDVKGYKDITIDGKIFKALGDNSLVKLGNKVIADHTAHLMALLDKRNRLNNLSTWLRVGNKWLKDKNVSWKIASKHLGLSELYPSERSLITKLLANGKVDEAIYLNARYHTRINQYEYEKTLRSLLSSSKVGQILLQYQTWSQGFLKKNLRVIRNMFLSDKKAQATTNIVSTILIGMATSLIVETMFGRLRKKGDEFFDRAKATVLQQLDPSKYTGTWGANTLASPFNLAINILSGDGNPQVVSQAAAFLGTIKNIGDTIRYKLFGEDDKAEKSLKKATMNFNNYADMTYVLYSFATNAADIFLDKRNANWLNVGLSNAMRDFDYEAKDLTRTGLEKIGNLVFQTRLSEDSDSSGGSGNKSKSSFSSSNFGKSSFGKSSF